jgi:4-hydroxybenzoate polyprenyltransferase
MKKSLTNIHPLSKLRIIASQLRVRQWVKNALVFSPILFSGERGQWTYFWDTSICAIAFCLLSSSSYILNDILDLKADREHPSKRNRPLAAGKLSLLSVVTLGLMCLFLSLFLAFYVRPTLILVFLLYLLINLAYSTYLKHIVIVDIFCVASGFVLRALAGALAIHVVLTGWFLLCTTFGAMFIALEKRRQELNLISTGKKAARRALEQYSPNLIRRMESILVASIVTSYAFYSFQSPHGQWMMITVPFVLYGVMRYQYVSERGDLAGTPEEIFWKDGPIQLTLILWTITCWIVIYVPPGAFFHQLSSIVDSIGK